MNSSIKNISKKIFLIKKIFIFAARIGLTHGVTAALQILVLPVQVRILVGQP